MYLFIFTFLLGSIFGFSLNLVFKIELQYVVLGLLLVLYISKVSYQYLKSSGKINLFKMMFELYKSPLVNKVKSVINSKKDFEVKIENNILIIDYVHKGIKHRHAVPYKEQKLFRNKKYQVYLVSNEKETEITQHPATTYKHSPSEYGVNQIKVLNKFTGKVTFYEGDQVPSLDDLKSV